MWAGHVGGEYSGPLPTKKKVGPQKNTCLIHSTQSAMAPVRSAKERAGYKGLARGGNSLPTPSSLFRDDFRTTKRDKRTIKHASFVSKIEKSSAKSNKRRRSSKKLVTNLESLVDALPETETELNDPSQVNVIKQKTLKHKPGALKRKEKIEKLERERFAKNMAQMSSIHAPTGPGSEPDTATSASSRWAALRGFISQTMEQQPIFKTN
ncbi:FAM207/SLX9 family protein [Aspergillus lucknowensis]|uniref:Ribosome biogenesis protein SLX9 n=1 Tax=Aspergillus lucknowensis TaxID=176173 RepID=A0ABR4LZE0_9EURO